MSGKWERILFEEAKQLQDRLPENNTSFIICTEKQGNSVFGLKRWYANNNTELECILDCLNPTNIYNFNPEGEGIFENNHSRCT